jgi:hypothetical protein
MLPCVLLPCIRAHLYMGASCMCFVPRAARIVPAAASTRFLLPSPGFSEDNSASSETGFVVGLVGTAGGGSAATLIPWLHFLSLGTSPRRRVTHPGPIPPLKLLEFI